MDENKKNVSEKLTPSFTLALTVMLINIAVLVGGLALLELDPHILMVICIIVTAFAGFKLKYTWQEMLDIMCHGINKAQSSLLFFFLIGMIIGAWMLSGTVPGIIYYGFNILSPSIFLPAGLIICSITAMATGSSWTVAGTVGVALMGIGTGMGIPAPITAGMVVSGGYFGDKMSPLSDTTNLAPSIAGTDVYTHIKAMTWTAGPAYIITIILYFVIGLGYSGGSMDVEAIKAIQSAIAGVFDLNIAVFLPLIFTLVASVLKVPAIPAMMIGIVTSIPISMGMQGASFVDVLETLNYGFSVESGLETVDALLNRGGLQSMMWTYSLAVIGLSMGGLLNGVGILDVLVEKILRLVPNRRFLPGATILTSLFVNFTMAEQYISIVIPGGLYEEAYRKSNLRPEMLSRALEEGGTLTSALIPWATCAAVMSGALGVSTLEYLPFAFFNLLNPLLGIVLPILGFTLLTSDDNKAV